MEGGALNFRTRARVCSCRSQRRGREGSWTESQAVSLGLLDHVQLPDLRLLVCNMQA